MRFQLSYPDEKQLKTYLDQQKNSKYSYEEVGATRNQQPGGYDNDYNHVVLGKGDIVWENAKQAIVSWQQYPKPWTNIYPVKAPLKKGQTVAVLFRVAGVWWRSSARIVYTIDESDRFGWAYGTLNDHVEKGEECFWIEKNEEGFVSYHIRAFSRPAFWMARFGYPLARYWQRRFVKESMETMQTISKQAQNESYAR